MPRSAEEIVRLLTLEQVTGSRYRGPQPEQTTLVKAYGGQTLAQGLAAAAHTVTPRRPPHSVQAFFVQPADTRRPVDYDVESVHDGRSVSARVVRACQDGRLLAQLFASFQEPEIGFEHSMSPPASVPPPEELPSLADVMHTASDLDAEEWRREWEALDLRYRSDQPTDAAGTGPGTQQLWVRVRGRLPDDPALHRQVLAYLSDLTLLAASLRPHGLTVGASELPRATMNHTVWFHADARVDEWLLIDQRSPWAGGARGLAFGSIHTRHGLLVASLAQEGMIRPYGGLRTRLLADRAAL